MSDDKPIGLTTHRGTIKVNYADTPPPSVMVSAETLGYILFELGVINEGMTAAEMKAAAETWLAEGHKIGLGIDEPLADEEPTAPGKPAYVEFRGQRISGEIDDK